MYLNVADEDEGVVVLNLLHGGLSGEGMLDDVVGIHAVPARGGLARVLWGPNRPEGLRSVELDAGAHLVGEKKSNKFLNKYNTTC